MVPTAPPAHAGEAQVDYHWLSKIARWLHLGRDKVAILVEGASVGGLRALASSLLHEASPPVVCFHAPELLDVPSGSLVVLTLHETELNWLNLNRPIIANKRLRLVLWLEFPLHRLRGGAPDFFDWISHVVRCPSRPPGFAVRGLLAAKAAGRSVAWRGRALDAVMERAGLEGVRVEAGEEFSALVARLEQRNGAIPVWMAAHDPWHALRVDVAMRDTGCPWWVVDHPGFEDDRYAVVHDDASSWEAATGRIAALLREADRSWAACASALVEAEPGMVELVRRSLVEGRSIAELCHALAHAKDPLDVLSDRPAHDDRRADALAQQIPPGCREVMKRHAHALETQRSTAWVMASDAARAAGHADIAESFAVRALTKAVHERGRLRARIAWAAACHSRGRYAEAHERFNETVELLGRAPPDDPLLALLLTEQATALSREQRHAEAVAEATQAIATWRSCARPSIPALLEALRLHGRSLAALGNRKGLTACLAVQEGHWPKGKLGQAYLMLERARSGDRSAQEQLARELRSAPPAAGFLSIALELAELRLDDGSPRASVGSCIRVSRLLRSRYGTTLHPQGIDARCLAGRALAEQHPAWAEALLRRALEDSETLQRGMPHPQAADVALQLADLLRHRGDLAASMALVERAERDRGTLEASYGSLRARSASAPPTAPTQRLLTSMGEHLDRRSDEVLLDRARSGDFHARELLLARYQPSIRRFFANEVPPDQVDDLVQQTLLWSFSALDRFEGRSSFRTYVFMAARRVLSSSTRNRLRGRLPPEDPTERHQGLLPGPEEALAEAAERSALAAALRQLSHEHQRIIFLRYFEELSSTEIASALDIPEGAARSRMRRAMAYLRESLMRALADPEIELPDDLDDPVAEWSTQMRASTGQAMG